MSIHVVLMTLCFSLLPFQIPAWAQTVDVNKINADEEGTTTIQIHKGKNKEIDITTAKPVVRWEVQDGSADVEGEVSATARDAKAAWKKACEDWKKEFRADNKENKILTLACGSANCDGEAGSKICSSKAVYKIKTRVDE